MCGINIPFFTGSKRHKSYPSAGWKQTLFGGLISNPVRIARQENPILFYGVKDSVKIGQRIY